MFMLTKLKPEDRDALRYLWCDDKRGDEKPTEYRMTSLIFGATSSPVTSICINNFNAEKYRETEPEVYTAVWTSNSKRLLSALNETSEQEQSIDLHTENRGGRVLVNCKRYGGEVPAGMMKSIKISPHRNDWKSQLINLKNEKIPRRYLRYTDATTLQLHTFVDASETAYTAALYWRALTLKNRNERYNKAVYSVSKKRASPASSPTGDHLSNRLAHHRRPFTYTGINYFGPLTVKIGRATTKKYVVLFTCLTTTAVHLEIAAPLDTSSAIMAPKKMNARLGCPTEICSDNGTNL
ncbi:hypothetical protein EVAR_25329_1 [Eumeta japonica]|uniref:Integrase catalytic domain-containing protein n=1 Tax=Eumeta variegata TaxID=151549 RepID=A0A4C1VRP0_EUMVA|nr:hypothetical protein EVAR_25329_1 [Eumeta japonica]